MALFEQPSQELPSNCAAQEQWNKFPLISRLYPQVNDNGKEQVQVEKPPEGEPFISPAQVPERQVN
jgi:hypothetical protein